MKGEENPYIRQRKKTHTIQLDDETASYFKGLAAELGMPYRNFINLYLRECAQKGVKLAPQPLIETNPFRRLEWDEVHLSTIDDFGAWLAHNPLFAPDRKVVIYRGQAREGWPLTSTLDRIERNGASYSHRLTIEREFLEEFRRSGNRFLGDVERRMMEGSDQGARVGAMAVMRHFGAPTRVLDWSKSRAVAAYFACIDEREYNAAIWWAEHDAIVASVHPLWSDRRFERHLVLREGRVVEGEINLDSGIFREDVENVDTFVTMVYCHIPFPRIIAQQGLFTLAAKFGVRHEEALAEQVPRTARGRVVIEAALKEKVIDYLERLGINAHTLQYAGADQVGLRMAWKEGGR